MSDTNANHDGSSPAAFAERVAAEARAELERLAAARAPHERALAEIAAHERAARQVLQATSPKKSSSTGRPVGRPRSNGQSTWRSTPTPKTIDRVLELLRQAPRPINISQLSAQPGAPSKNTISCAFDFLLERGVVRRAGADGNSHLWDLMPEYEHATPQPADA
jgi:hypothetical protein